MSILSVTSVITDNDAMSPTQNAAGVTLPCVYCRADISADDFVFWTGARRLLSATCPQCSRRVTFAASTWHRWTSQTQA